MNWQRENQLAELAHTLRVLARRHFLGEIGAKEHRRQLELLVARYELADPHPEARLPR
jgi:hypothetical protein